MHLSRMTIASAIALAAALALSGPARAATEAAFTQAQFEASEQQGRPILIHITAPWCPTCAQQRPVVEKLAADPRFAELIIYNVDFDTQKDVVRAFGAQSQSTLIAFHGKAETARSVGDTDPASITALVGRTLG